MAQSWKDKLTKAQKAELAKDAMQAAKNLGYCGEARNVLEEMGLDAETQGILTITLNADVPLGTDFGNVEVYVQITDSDTGNYVVEEYDASVVFTPAKA